jgi:uncharacterized membrane protein YdjX (TVP38/TMEM64 family)
MLRRLLAESKGSLGLLLYFSVVPSLFGSLLASYVLYHAHEIRLLPFFFIFLFNLAASLGLGLGFMPTTFYSLLAGYLFGWDSLPHLFFSYLLAAAFSYTLAGMLDKGKLFRLLAEKYPLEKVLSKLSGPGIVLASLLRLSPIPFTVLNTVFAMARFPFSKYLIGSVLGMVPRTVFLVYVGQAFTKVKSIADLESQASTWVVLVLAFVSFAGVGWIVKKRLFGTEEGNIV